MRIDRMVGVRLALAGLAAAAVALGTQPAEPRITLVDNTVAAPTPWDVGDPSVGLLDPQLLTALQQAATAADADGVTMTVTSGWRTPEFQQQLLDDAVVTYGNYQAARQYVQTPAESKHVVGLAVDIGGTGAAQWLIANGARFGLCQIYANESWHFERVADANGVCPPLLPNAAT